MCWLRFAFGLLDPRTRLMRDITRSLQTALARQQQATEEVIGAANGRNSAAHARLLQALEARERPLLPP